MKKQTRANAGIPSANYAALNSEQKEAVMCYAVNVLKRQRDKPLAFATTLDLMAKSPKMVNKAELFTAKIRDEREANPELQPWFN